MSVGIGWAVVAVVAAFLGGSAVGFRLAWTIHLSRLRALRLHLASVGRTLEHAVSLLGRLQVPAVALDRFEETARNLIALDPDRETPR